MKHLNNQELLEHTQLLVEEERKITVEILHALIEIEARRLFLALGYPSLWDMLRHHYKYSESAAQRRKSGMDLIKAHPEVEEKIESGAISLTVAAQAQTFMRSEVGLAMPEQEKKEFLQNLEGKSTREAEKEIRTLDPWKVPKEKERRLTEELIELRFVITEEQRQKLEALKARHSHKYPHMGYQELFQLLVNDAFDAPLPPAPAVETKSVTPKLRKYILARDGHQCTHTQDGKRCMATHFLQIDHINPKFLGGTNHPDNLRTLCQAHNLKAAEEKLGEGFMARYRNSA